MSARTDSQQRPPGFAAYLVVTGAYWAFMLSDGALRMLVLLHFHVLGFTPVQIAYLFLLYEFMGMVTNLYAGWLAARFGMTLTLYLGLGLQVVGLVTLSALQPDWALWLSVAFVMGVQGLAGVAKDLTKMSSKSAVRVLVPDDAQGQLFTWVARLTGSKNAVKGLGFLLGAGLLAGIGFQAALLAMAGVLAALLVAVMAAMPSGLPAGRKGVAFSAVFSKDRRVNLLSAARVFLFAARDVWFVVGVPIYFYEVLSTTAGLTMREAFMAIGCFMGVWIVGYGLVQTLAPRVLRADGRSLAETAALTRGWVAALAVIPAGLAGLAWLSGGAQRLADGGDRGRAAAVRRGVRDQFLAALLPDPGVFQARAGHARRRLLLHVERRRPAAGHAAVRAQLPDHGPHGLPRRRRPDGRPQLAVGPAAAARIRGCVILDC